MSRDTLPSLTGMLAELVALPSMSSVSPEFDHGNQAVIDLLAGWLEDLDFRVEILPVADHPQKSNLIATLGEGPGGLVLAGHTDTVPCDPSRWRHDPFRLHEDGGRFHGLGTADMKGFFPLVLEAVRPLRAADLKAPLIVLATADEESSMNGARALVAAGRPRARHAVIGEPTSLVPVRAHKGILMEAVEVTGRSGHSSDPALGDNALEGMHRVMAELLAWRVELQQRHRDERFAVPVPTLNLGHIHGGDNPNRICGRCELHFDLRPLPGMGLDELRGELDARLARCFAGSPLAVRRRSLIQGTEPLDTPAGAAIVRAAEELTGHAAESAAYCTEGPYLNALGMDTVVLGPGRIDQAHRPDEYLEAASIQPMLGVLTELIERFCVRAQPGT